MIEERFFHSRFIVKNDPSLGIICMGDNMLWKASCLQNEKKRTWHSRPYEYFFIVSSMLKTFHFGIIKLDKILDLACGIEHPGYRAIANLSQTKHIVALDTDKRLLDNGIEYPGKVYKVIGDATNTGLKKESFDVISCVSFLEHIPNWKDAIREIYRLLIPGGMAFVTIDISIDPAKTLKHNVDGKIPDDYKNAFEKAGLYVFGSYNGNLLENTVDAMCSKYPLAINESELLKGQHNALKAFRMVLRKDA